MLTIKIGKLSAKNFPHAPKPRETSLTKLTTNSSVNHKLFHTPENSQMRKEKYCNCTQKGQFYVTYRIVAVYPNCCISISTFRDQRHLL